MYFREPTYNGDLINGFTPVQNNNINCLDINNDGLNVISDPRQNANEFWTQLHERAQQIIDGK